MTKVSRMCKKQLLFLTGFEEKVMFIRFILCQKKRTIIAIFILRKLREKSKLDTEAVLCV